MALIRQHPVKPVILKIPQAVLDETLDLVTSHLEAYLGNPENTDHLDTLTGALEEIRGLMDMLPLEGGGRLCRELQATVPLLREKSGRALKRLAGLMGDGIVALPRYYDSAVLLQEETPVLLLPVINPLRAARGEALILESMLAEAFEATDLLPETATVPADVSAEEVGRLRHMFQVGLVRVIQGRQQRLSLRLIHRAISRLADLNEDSEALSEFWQWSLGLLDALLLQRMVMTLSRKRLLMQLEAVVRQQSAGADTVCLPHADWQKEMLYLMAVSGSSSPLCRHLVDDHLPGIETGVTEKTLEAARQRMMGQTRETLDSVIHELQVELSKARPLIETMEAKGGGTRQQLNDLGRIFHRLSHALRIVGLHEPSDLLKQQLLVLKAWFQGEAYDRARLIALADALLFIESTVNGLEGSEGSTERKDATTTVAGEEREFLMSRRQLVEAQNLVIEECVGGIALAKRAIDAYVNSNFDEVHIANLNATLHTVRGGLIMLGLSRPAAVLASCNRFIQAVVGEEVEVNRIRGMLDTLADALITLEHYLEEYEVARRANDDILQIAEESLSAIGYPVEAPAEEA